MGTTTVDLSIVPADVGLVMACIRSTCFMQGFACSMDPVCSNAASELLTGTPTTEETAVILWTMLGLKGSNSAVAGVLQCADSQCGTNLMAATSATTWTTTATTSRTSSSTSSTSTS